ncbi:MAG: efflux transporter outer membrane subunit [Burkholderiales bacterium]|nr:efflux transporter outer membrane subunit [Burkholderiales bacterium]
MQRIVLLLATAGVVAGCAVTQPAPPKYDLPPTAATAAQSELLEHWWTAFDDPVLTRLVEEALAHNWDVRTALARIDAARSQVLLAQANLVPSVDLGVGATRSRSSAETIPKLPDGTQLASNRYTVQLQAAYELDLWGKYRAGLLASDNELAASQYYVQTVRIGIAADTASAYFRLRAADAELAVLRDTLRLRTETVQLQRDRFEGGLIGEYDLRSAEAERSAVVADVARTESAVGELESAIATLAGRSPRAVFQPEVARGASIEAVTEVPELPPGLPSGLLERRPDIRRAEALLAASDLRIQAARAEYFPAISLTGAYGVQSAAMSSLFTGPAAIWTLGAALLQPVLGLKAIESQVELAKARREEVTAQYAQTIQVAFRDVHDALLAHRAARDVLAAETDRRNQIAKAYDVALLRYDAGRTSFLEVIDAQRTLLVAETLRIDAARDAKLAIVAFARALGGGWKPESYLATR